MAVKLTIDGRAVEVPEGTLLIEACKEVGISVPHFCYHPGLGPEGSCRMCQVEIKTERGLRLAISCKTVVSEGMEVVTGGERAREVRAAVEEFLLLDHPLDCPICDKFGECTLQQYYMEHDRRDSRLEFEKLKKRKAVVLGPTLVLDQERCILCNRCVRFLRNVAGDEELFIAGRGHRSYLTNFPGREVRSPYSLNTVDLCPVGALTSRDFRFASPVWFLRSTPSICTTCSRGCSVHIDHRDGKIYRLRPRHNPEVNGYWMCDEGRLNYKFVNARRLTRFFLHRNGAGVELLREEALEELGRIFEKARGGSVLLLASASCTVEELYALKKLSALSGARLFAVKHVEDGPEDDLLRKSDQHGNVKGAELLGLEVADLREADASADWEEAGCTLAFAAGFDYSVPPALRAFLSRSRSSVVVSAHDDELARAADLALPGLTFAEKEGTVVNFAGRVQALHRANVGAVYVDESKGEEPAVPALWELVSRLLERLSPGAGWRSMAELRREISDGERAFAAVDLERLGESGSQAGSG